jgi:hypothetical protein
MAPPKIDLDIYKEFIKSLYFNGSVIIDSIAAIFTKRVKEMVI